jgi:hypothetical protein
MPRPHQLPPYPGTDVVPAAPLPPAVGWPMALHFATRKGKLALCMYHRVAFRAPKAGEFFISGAIPQAYRAAQNLPKTSRYWIVHPTHYARRLGVSRGPAIKPGDF